MVQFPAVVSVVERAGEKVKRTGMTRHDVAWMTGSLLGLRPAPSRVTVTAKEFEAVGLDSAFVDAQTITPGKPISIENKFEMGRLYIAFPLEEITDYKILRGRKITRFVVSSWQAYVILQAVGWKIIRRPSARKDLIVSSHRYYEDIGINSHEGPGLMSDYDEYFVKFCFKLFQALERDGLVAPDPGFLLPYCPQHGRTGEWDRGDSVWRCPRCGREIPWSEPRRGKRETGEYATDRGHS